ncbi:MAG: class I SAM-dependent methyltransferase, partial [Nitrospiraceae bacterium]
APLPTSWISADWNETLPIRNARVDRIICHLGLGFVDYPLLLVKDMLRLLAPTGSLIVTCWTPGTDLSFLYRQHLRQTGQNEFSDQSRTLLQHLGEAQQGLREGLIHTFGRDALGQLLTLGGGARPHIVTAMSGQLLLAVTGKPDSSS